MADFNFEGLARVPIQVRAVMLTRMTVGFEVPLFAKLEFTAASRVYSVDVNLTEMETRGVARFLRARFPNEGGGDGELAVSALRKTLSRLVTFDGRSIAAVCGLSAAEDALVKRLIGGE